jgi:hypothetical protein
MCDLDYDQHSSALVDLIVAFADSPFLLTASRGTLLLITKIVRAGRFLCVDYRYFIDLIFLAFRNTLSRNDQYILSVLKVQSSANFLRSSSTSARRRTLPTMVVGKSSRNSTYLGTL